MTGGWETREPGAKRARRGAAHTRCAMTENDGAITIRTMREADTAEAERVMRVAFGTFLRLPDPASFAGDACMVAPRFAAEPRAAFVAERGGAVVGSCLAVRWGDVAFFGPLTVRPDLWDQGVAKRLLARRSQTEEGSGFHHSPFKAFVTVSCAAARAAGVIASISRIHPPAS